MGILLAFLPFVAFVIVERLVGPLAGLVTGAVVSAGLIGYEMGVRKHSAKVLEIGTFCLFAGLAAWVYATHVQWPIAAVRLRVDLGLLAIVLLSMAIGQPFTLQYAREQTERAVWGRPEFRRTNYVITGVWALAFAVMVLTDLMMLSGLEQRRPLLPIVVTVAALYGAARFTAWYPSRVRG